MGFYGALASLTMAVSFYSQKNKRASSLIYFFLYVSLLVSSLIGFFVDGYNVMTKIISFLIYLFWIFIAQKSLFEAPFEEKAWRRISCYSLAMAAIFLIAIVYQGKEAIYFETAKLVKAFLLTLLLGYFTPMALLNLRFQPPPVTAWVVLTFIASVGLVLPIGNLLNSVSMTTLAIMTAWKQKRDASFINKKSKFSWLLLALGLVIFNFFYDSHYMGIASLHYWILGPLVLSFVKFKFPILETSYSVILMVFILLLVSLDPVVTSSLNLNFQKIQFIASVVGMVLSFIIALELLLGLFKGLDFKRSSSNEN